MKIFDYDHFNLIKKFSLPILFNENKIGIECKNYCFFKKFKL